MKSIKFGDKRAQQVVSDEIKSVIKTNLYQNMGFSDMDKSYMESFKFYHYLNEKNLHLLNDRDFKVCVNTFGHKYLLFLTKYQNQNYAFFINKKKEDIFWIQFQFNASLFENTLFDGELIKNNQNQWLFIIFDLYLYKGQSIYDNSTLDQRQAQLHQLIQNEFVVTDQNYCPIELKEYWELKYLADLYQSRIPSLNYKCSGLYFQHISLYNKGLMYILPECRSGNTATVQLSNRGLSQTADSSGNETPAAAAVVSPDLDGKKTYRFTVKKTDLPDVYQIFLDQCHCGFLGVKNMEMSLKLAEHFKDIAEDEMECEYYEGFGKWVPHGTF